MIRAVVDTNIVVSGLLSARGNEALVLLAIGQRLVRPCFSTAILEEYAEVLARPKFSFPVDDIEALLTMLRASGELVATAEMDSPALPDPDDALFLQCAIAARAAYIVTGNKKHFPREACGEVGVLSAVELLDQITLAG